MCSSYIQCSFWYQYTTSLKMRAGLPGLQTLKSFSYILCKCKFGTRFLCRSTYSTILLSFYLQFCMYATENWPFLELILFLEPTSHAKALNWACPPSFDHVKKENIWTVCKYNHVNDQIKVIIIIIKYFLKLDQWFPKSAPRTTGGPRDQLNPHRI